MRAASSHRYLRDVMTGWPAGLGYALFVGLVLLALGACVMALATAASAAEPQLLGPFRWPPLTGIA